MCTNHNCNRVAAAPSFPGLRRFPQGRRFKQWTGDDSKALMKVRTHIFSQFISITNVISLGVFERHLGACTH